jgi:hypothetical protein
MLLRSRNVISPNWRDLLHTQNLDTVEGVYRLSSGQVITRSSSTEVRCVRIVAGTELRTIFVKKYWTRKPAQLWSGMFRGTFFRQSKVRREYENLVQLRLWNLDAPEPLAFGEERYAGWLLRSYLISSGVPEPMPLDIFVTRYLPGLPLDDARRVRRELIANLAEYTRKLHEQSFVHHDYFWRNILLSRHEFHRFFLIDAHKGRRWFPWKEQRGRAKDLAALDAPAARYFRRTERLRFFLAYRRHQTLDPNDKALVRLTLRLAEPMRAMQLRRVDSP